MQTQLRLRSFSFDYTVLRNVLQYAISLEAGSKGTKVLALSFRNVGTQRQDCKLAVSCPPRNVKSHIERYEACRLKKEDPVVTGSWFGSKASCLFRLCMGTHWHDYSLYLLASPSRCRHRSLPTQDRAVHAQTQSHSWELTGHLLEMFTKHRAPIRSESHGRLTIHTYAGPCPPISCCV